MRKHLVPTHLKPPPAPPTTSTQTISFPVRTSAAFFNSLSTNLRIADSSDFDFGYPSPLSTPLLRPCDYPMPAPASPSPLSHAVSSSDLEPISPHDLSTQNGEAKPDTPVDPLAGIPELTTFTAETEEDQVAALRLVADSVAQDRQFASRVLIFHPLNMAVLTVILAVATQWLYRDRGDAARVFTTWAGLVMAYLLAVRYFTERYTALAEEINWDWLGKDRLVVTRFGEEIIGVLVLGWVSGDGRGSRRKRVGRGLIRAWTVKLRYRGKGVGTGLLEEAVQIVNEKGGDGIDFAEEHANSKRVLKQFYNQPFDKRDMRAQHALDEVVKQKGTFVKRGSR